MRTPFTAITPSYNAGENDTPYREHRQGWDRHVGAAVISARSWRTVALAALALAAASVAGVVVVALQQRTYVHVVEVSPQGEPMNIRTADADWRPNAVQTAYHIGRFVRLVRSLPTDGVVLRENWVEAYKFLTPKSANELTAIARDDDPFLKLGSVGRTVHIRSIIKRSDHSWEVSWVERETNSSGTPDDEPYDGIFTVTTRAPRTADEIATNPLGILITDFSWSRVR